MIKWKIYEFCWWPKLFMALCNKFVNHNTMPNVTQIMDILSACLYIHEWMSIFSVYVRVCESERGRERNREWASFFFFLLLVPQIKGATFTPCRGLLGVIALWKGKKKTEEVHIRKMCRTDIAWFWTWGDEDFSYQGSTLSEVKKRKEYETIYSFIFDQENK